MLSRLAEHVYWAIRYVERVENSARLIHTFDQLLFDLPQDLGLSWPILIDILADKDLFHERFSSLDERHIIRFLTLDPHNPVSLHTSAHQAKNNARAVRALLPRDMSEQINQLARQIHQTASVSRQKRHDFLNQCIDTCQEIIGIAYSAMSYDDAHQFLRMAYHLERADFTTRLMASFAQKLTGEDSARKAYEGSAWISVLQCVCGDQMYRSHVSPRIKAPKVLTFLLKDPHFPRSIWHNLSRVDKVLQRLPSQPELRTLVANCSAFIQHMDVYEQSMSIFQRDLTSLQEWLSEIHQHISTTYFRLDDDAIH